MGLFSFLKNAGAKIFNRDEAKPEVSEATRAAEERILEQQKEMQLRGIIDSMGIEVENLSIKVNDDTVTLYGQTESQAQKEKIILAVGNVHGIATVDDRISVVKEEAEAEFYEVERGDSLSKIAKRFYGDPMKYKAIFEANKPMLEDPDKIYPGQKLRIPKMDK